MVLIKIDWYNVFGDRVWFGLYRLRSGTWKWKWHAEPWVIEKYNIPWHRCFKIRSFGVQKILANADD